MKVAIYCRLSAEDRDKSYAEDDSDSIQNQKAMLIKYASKNGWTIYDIYSDDDYAGTDRRRPEFNRLIADANDRKFDIVLCKSQSRFTRELELVEQYINGLFPRIGIRFVSLVDSADSANKGNKKSRQINGLVNEWFLEELSENIRSVKTSQRLRGYHIGSFAPYGYSKDPDKKGHLIIDPEAAEVIRMIYKLYLEGKGKQVIARTLNESGIPNPTEYKRQHGMLRNKKANSSPLWSYFTISNILTNEVYIGNMIQGKSGVPDFRTQGKVTYSPEHWIVVNGTHEPIIDPFTWDQVQAMIANKTTSGQKQPEGIFARKVRCIHCGSRMHSVKNGNKRAFKCGRHAIAHDACVGAYISLPKLERVVAAELHVLSRALLDEEALEEGINPLPELEVLKKQIEADITSLEHEIEANHTAIRSLYMSKVRGGIAEQDYIEQAIQISEEKNFMENKVAELREQIGQIEHTMATYQNRKLLVRQYVDTRTLSKEMVAVLVDHILVGHRDPMTKETPVEIYWNF